MPKGCCGDGSNRTAYQSNGHYFQTRTLYCWGPVQKAKPARGISQCLAKQSGKEVVQEQRSTWQSRPQRVKAANSSGQKPRPHPPRKCSLEKSMPWRGNGEAKKSDVLPATGLSNHKIGKIIRSNPVLSIPDPNKQTAVYGIHKPLTLILFSAYLLEAVCQLSATHVNPGWLPPLVGGGIGFGFTILNRFGTRRFWRAPEQKLNVVITGSTRGIGKAIARVFLRKGDRVMITSSSPSNVRQALRELRDEVGDNAEVFGVECDVSSPSAVQRLAAASVSLMGSVDVWINNAGHSSRYSAFVDLSPEQLQTVVQTNLTGTLLGTRAALRVMSQQQGGGHVFNIDGAGADGLATPCYAAYGATKAGISHLMRSLLREQKPQEAAGKGKTGLKAGGGPVGIHTLSPGMVLTPLLLEGATERNKAVFNVLCEQPETVAAFLVPRIRTVAARGEDGKYIRFLTLPAALGRLLRAPFAANRFFSKHGEALYVGERERILSPSHAKATRRRALNAARRDKQLALAYSLSLAASFAILVAEAQGVNIRLPLS